MNTTLVCVINSNTYMNSITTTSLPTHIKNLQQPLELEHYYPCTNEFNTYITQSQYQVSHKQLAMFINYVIYVSITCSHTTYLKP